MGPEIVMALVGVVCSAISSVVTFLLTRRKYNSEVDSQVVENVKNAFEAYKQVMEETIASQEKKIEKLQSENDYLKKQFEMMQNQLVNLLLNEGLKAQGIKIEAKREE
jgi:uncharacterized membrane protein (DUF106 family)